MRLRGIPRCSRISSIFKAHCGTLEACFSSPTLPAISPGAMKRKTCQNGIIPRHHHQDDAHRLVTDKTAACRRLDGLVGEKAFRIFGIVAAGPGALDGLVHRRAKGLAHFEWSSGGRAILFQSREFLPPSSSIAARSANDNLWNVRKTSAARCDFLVDLSVGESLEGLDGLSCCGIDRCDRHVFFLSSKTSDRD